MNGIAIVIPNADFSNNNLGQVTFLEAEPVSGITIVADASYSGTTFTPSVRYTPATTNQTGVTWSITSGGTYASIDSSTGVVTIDQNASNNSITIKAMSNYNNAVFGTATVSVTYVASGSALNGITIIAVKSGINTYSLVTVYDPIDTSSTGVTYTITSGSSYVSLNGSTLTVLNTATTAQSVVIRGTSTVDPSVYNTVTVNVIYEEAPSWNLRTKVGAIEGVNSGIFATMAANPYTIMWKFTDDSTVIPAGNNGTVFSIGGDNSNPELYAPPAGMWQSFRKKYKICASNLKGSGWTAGRTAGNASTARKQYFIDESGSPITQGSPNDIGGKCYIIGQDSSNTSYLYVNDTDAGTPTSTTNYLSFMKYITFGFMSMPQNATDYNTCSDIVTNVGVNAYASPGSLDGVYKLCNFIIVQGSYTSEADVLAARNNALVDIKFDTNGEPYNAGSAGTLMLMDVQS